uniref:Transcriptional coactivator p15 (PC4) C-terminal domain-containing protein n=1 Tax=Plectus sambesii TaxID=2011161 RepID=A0A914WBS6_9BILA
MALFMSNTTVRLAKIIVSVPQASSLSLNIAKRCVSTGSKDLKTVDGQDFERRRSDDNVEMVGIGKSRYVSVYVFTTPQVEIREFYNAPNGPIGKLLPGRKGINMSIEQYENFKKLIPEIDRKLSDVHSLPILKVPEKPEINPSKTSNINEYS